MLNKIGWCTETWNPIVGCQKISDGCLNCWAYKMAQRQAGHFKFSPVPPPEANETYAAYALVKQWDGTTRLIRDTLDNLICWKKPRRIAVCLMGDLFAADFADIDEVMKVIHNATQHKYIFCTKRPLAMVEYWQSFTNDKNKIALALNNSIFLVSVENQATTDERIPELIKLKSLDPHFRIGVSAEPILDKIDLTPYLKDLDWVIAGGETGQKARICWEKWINELYSQCKEYSVPFWFKQWGNNRRRNYGESGDLIKEIEHCRQFERGYNEQSN